MTRQLRLLALLTATVVGIAWLVPAQKEIMPIIKQVRKDKGLDIIFDLGKSGVAFMSPALDRTAEVLRRYDVLKAAPPGQEVAPSEA